VNVAIVLAAGSSSRMGQPKQLLDWHGRPLLHHTIEELVSAGLDRVVVVLGAHADAIENQLSGRSPDNVLFVRNPEWAAGQATSLVSGLRALPTDSAEIQNVLLVLCDQPFVTAADYRMLMETIGTGSASAVATRYDSGGGVPAALAWSACVQLLEIKGDTGARGWLRSQPDEEVELVDIPGALRDLDYPDQYVQAREESREMIQE